MDSIIAIIFDRCCRMEIKKGGTKRNPLLLVSVTHKDGWLKKVWLLSNHLNFSNVDWSFLLVFVVGDATCFWKVFNESLPKSMTTSLLWRLKKFDCHLKNNENFQLPHLVPFWLPPLWWLKILITNIMLIEVFWVTLFCGNPFRWWLNFFWLPSYSGGLLDTIEFFSRQKRKATMKFPF